MGNVEIVDLSYEISSDMLVYPGMERPVFQWLGRANSEGYNLTKVGFVTHVGTHVDAPIHYVDGKEHIDEVSLDRLFGRASLYRYKKECTGQEISLKEMQSDGYEPEEGAIFVMDTGVEKYSGQKEFFQLHPALSKEAVQWLIGRKIKCFMTNAISPDFVGNELQNHVTLFDAGIPVVENLRNLGRLPENKPFLISALPLKLKKREASPCRAVAVLGMDL